MTVEAQLMCQASLTYSLPWLQVYTWSKTALLKGHWRLCKSIMFKAFISMKLNFCENSWYCSHFCNPLSSDKSCVGWEEVWRRWPLSFETQFPFQDGWNFASSSVLKNYSLESWRWQETCRILTVCIELPETVLITVLFGKTVHTISRKLCFWKNSLVKAAGTLLYAFYFGKWILNGAFPQWQSYAMQSNTSGNLCHICVLTANKGM